MIMQNADGSVTLRTDQDIDDYFNIWLTWYKRWWYKLRYGYWLCYLGCHTNDAIRRGIPYRTYQECERCGFSPTWER